MFRSPAELKRKKNFGKRKDCRYWDIVTYINKSFYLCRC